MAKRKMSENSLKNLKPMSERPQSERIEIARKGAQKTNQIRREKRKREHMLSDLFELLDKEGIIDGTIESIKKEVESGVIKNAIELLKLVKPNELQEQRITGALDIGFVEGEITHPDLVVLPVMQDALAAVAAKPAPPMTLAQFCSTYPLLLRESGSGTRDLFEQQIQQKGILCQPSWVCSNTQTLLSAAEMGLGATVISRLLAAEALQEGRLHEILLQDCQMMRTFCLVWHKDKFQGNGFLTFCHICKEFGAVHDLSIK